MKKKTRFIVIVVSIFSLSLLVLAPRLLHKREITNPNTIIASQVEPANIEKEEPTRPDASAPLFNKLQESVSKTIPRSVVKNDPPDTKASVSEPEKITAQKPNPVTQEKNPSKINTNKPVIPQDYQPYVEKKPGSLRQSQKMEPDSQAIAVTPEQPSVWGTFVIATSSGVDGGVSYRLIQIPILKGIDLDLMAGIKQAGFGLSKYVYHNLGLGLAGTITYNTGVKKLGVYGKYSF